MNATIPKHTFRRRLVLGVCALLALAALPVLTQTAWAHTAPAGGQTPPVITVPPRPMTVIQGVTTLGADSTLWSSGVPGPQNSSVTIPIPASGTSGGGGGGATTCTPSTTPITQTANCPAGDTAGGATGGPTSFTQTQTVDTSCPNGSSGAPSTTTTAWSPSVASECLPAGSVDGPVQTCSVSCPVFCRISVGGDSRMATQYWAGGGGAGCSAGGTPTGQFNSNYTAGSTTPACSGDQTYTYTSTSSCP